MGCIIFLISRLSVLFFIFRRASSQVPEKVASTNCDHTIDLADNKHVSKTFFVQYHVVVL